MILSESDQHLTTLNLRSKLKRKEESDRFEESGRIRNQYNVLKNLYFDIFLSDSF